MTKSPIKPASKLRPEPDEVGEGRILRQTPSGGVELRVTEDHGDPPMGEQMAAVEDEMLHPKKTPKRS